MSRLPVVTRVGVPASLMARVPHLAIFLQPWGLPAVLGRKVGRHHELTAVAGWGRDTGRQSIEAQNAARRLGLPYLALDNGFLRSISAPHIDIPPWDIVVDDIGIYYATGLPSRFAQIAAESEPASDTTEKLMGLIRQLAVTGSVSPSTVKPQPLLETPYVVVLDQSANDPSIKGAGATAENFEAMLDAAIAENLDAEIKVQLDLNGIISANHTALAKSARQRGLTIDHSAAGWMACLHRASRVYTVSSRDGLDVLVRHKPLTCYGAAFYAGHGFTDDRVVCHRESLSLDGFVHAVYERYARYVDPVHDRSSDAVTVANRLTVLRLKNEETAAPAFVHGVSRWKQPFVTPFIAGRQNAPRYVAASKRTVRQCADAGGRLLSWAAREPEWLAKTAQEAGLKLSRIEDGFIRSVGLGSNFTPALSLVVDDFGIYFDPSRESGLERILNAEQPAPELLNAARMLRIQMIEGRFSKYNMEPPADRQIPLREGARVIIVPGQVEDDASIRLGSPVIKTNLDLIRAVRAAVPQATILYKPHPDVESGNRPGVVPELEALRHADAVIAGWDAPSALEAADEIHTMTSLLGFEGLMRGKHVVTYGLPFYAGLGLTEDRLPWPRIRRPADLDTLVAAAYLLYPRYREPRTNLPVTAFDVLEMIERMRVAGVRPHTRVGRYQRWIKLVFARRSA